MSIKRYGVEGGTGTGGQHLPFARAVEGGIVDQSRLAIQNCVDIMTEAGYTLADVVHVKVILTDARYFQSFNKVFREFFGDNPPARICCVADLVVDCKVEVDVTCFNAARQ
mgnify:CR=1 FL=1